MAWKTFSVAVLVIAISIIYNALTKTKIPGPVVEISTGKLQGAVSKSRAGRDYFEYLGIPFAKPPLGKLRFEPPQPAEKWDGILDATEFRAKCIQIHMVTKFFEGEEDCLFLNVFVPKVAESKKPLPVFVFIHGGLFMFGAAEVFGPKYFMDEDIILVTIQYRVGALGFLNTGDDVVRGNMGLKDQVESLKWVQRNIGAFGGDANSITIGGESAGAASVQLHMLSPMSKGLFHRAISQSGNALSPWAIRRNPREQAERFAKQLNCPSDNSESMVKCLKELNAYKIGEVHKETLDLFSESIVIFCVTVESKNDSQTFLSDEPRTLLESGKISNKVPWISGVNSDEGLILSSAIVSNETMMSELQNNWLDIAPRIFFYERDDKVSKKTKKNYFGKSKKIGTTKNFHTFTRMLSDRSFFSPVHESAKLQSKYSTVRLYYYTHIGDFSLANFLRSFRGKFPVILELAYAYVSAWINKHVLGTRTPVLGVCHSDEQPMMFNMPHAAEITSDDAEQFHMSVSIVKLWASFVKNEKTSLHFRDAEWTPVDPTKSTLRYFHLDMSYGMVDEPFTKRITFWKELLSTGFK